jgi:hypothetical protein
MPDGDNNNRDIIMLPDSLFVNAITIEADIFPLMEIMINLADENLMDQLNAVKGKYWDEDLRVTFNNLFEGCATNEEKADFTIDTNDSATCLFYCGQLYIPNKPGL